MEVPQLRPLGVGDIVDRVFALYRSRPLLYIAASAVPYLLFVLVIVVLYVLVLFFLLVCYGINLLTESDKLIHKPIYKVQGQLMGSLLDCVHSPSGHGRPCRRSGDPPRRGVEGKLELTEAARLTNRA